MESKARLQEYLIKSKAPKDVLNAMRDLDETLQKETQDADMFLSSLAERDADVVRLEGQIKELQYTVDFWHKAWRGIYQSLEEARNWSSLWKQAAKINRKFGQQMADRVEDAEQSAHDEAIQSYKF